jgi:predicted xylose isomerase-like sugar epimerase
MVHTINQEPTQVEQVAASTVQGLRLLEKILGYDFEEAIYHIEKLTDMRLARYQSLIDYAQESGKEVRTIVALNKEGK